MKSLCLLVALCVLATCGGAPGERDASSALLDDAAADPAPDADGAVGALVIDARQHDASAEDAPAGGAKACRQATEVSRACQGDTDCALVTHTTSCCGTMTWIGIRASTKTEFDTLEAACDRSYPACACQAYAPVTDDGSVIPLGSVDAVSVSCQAGTCKTFATACGHPCGAGSTCNAAKGQCRPR